MRQHSLAKGRCLPDFEHDDRRAGDKGAASDLRENRLGIEVVDSVEGQRPALGQISDSLRVCMISTGCSS